MKGKPLRIVKKTADVCMTVLLLCLMAYQVTGETLHEWFGIGMTALLIVHHILNIRWYSALFKGKYGASRTVSAACRTSFVFQRLFMFTPRQTYSQYQYQYYVNFFQICFLIKQLYHLPVS